MTEEPAWTVQLSHKSGRWTALVSGPADTGGGTARDRAVDAAVAAMAAATQTPRAAAAAALGVREDAVHLTFADTRWGTDRRIAAPERERLTEQAVAAYEQGASIRTVAAQAGVAFATARRLLVDAGVTLRGRGGGRGRRHSGGAQG